MNLIFELVDTYKVFLDRKAELADATKENNKKIDEIKEALVQAMIDEECTKISRNGFVYSLQAKTKYNKRSEEYLLKNGIDFFATLREEGLGDLIKETVDNRLLSAAIGNYIEENGELSPELENIVSVYEFYDISKRKDK